MLSHGSLVSLRESFPKNFIRKPSELNRLQKLLSGSGNLKGSF
jgi:hypothetical protein